MTQTQHIHKSNRNIRECETTGVRIQTHNAGGGHKVAQHVLLLLFE